MNTPCSPLGDRASLSRAHGNLKKAAGLCTRICSSLSAAHQHRCSSVFQADASAPPFFISLGRQNGQAQLYFHQGKVRITHRSSGRGSLNFCRRDGSGWRRGHWTALLQHQWPCHGAGILALSLRAGFQQQQQEHTGGGCLSLCSWHHCFIPSFSSQRYG